MRTRPVRQKSLQWQRDRILHLFIPASSESFISSRKWPQRIRFQNVVEHKGEEESGNFNHHAILMILPVLSQMCSLLPYNSWTERQGNEHRHRHQANNIILCVFFRYAVVLAWMTRIIMKTKQFSGKDTHDEWEMRREHVCKGQEEFGVFVAIITRGESVREMEPKLFSLVFRDEKSVLTALRGTQNVNEWERRVSLLLRVDEHQLREGRRGGEIRRDPLSMYKQHKNQNLSRSLNSQRRRRILLFAWSRIIKLSSSLSLLIPTVILSYLPPFSAPATGRKRSHFPPEHTVDETHSFPGRFVRNISPSLFPPILISWERRESHFLPSFALLASRIEPFHWFSDRRSFQLSTSLTLTYRRLKSRELDTLSSDFYLFSLSLSSSLSPLLST